MNKLPTLWTDTSYAFLEVSAMARAKYWLNDWLRLSITEAHGISPYYDPNGYGFRSLLNGGRFNRYVQILLEFLF